MFPDDIGRIGTLTFIGLVLTSWLILGFNSRSVAIGYELMTRVVPDISALKYGNVCVFIYCYVTRHFCVYFV